GCQRAQQPVTAGAVEVVGWLIENQQLAVSINQYIDWHTAFASKPAPTFLAGVRPFPQLL
ncbi:hypothetical protein, partial [Pseudomonas putida]